MRAAVHNEPDDFRGDTIARCWNCVGESMPSTRDAQCAALCARCERQRIRGLMGLDGPRTPLSACCAVDDRATLSQIASAWQSIVGELVSLYCRPVALHGGVLTVECATVQCERELAPAVGYIIRKIGGPEHAIVRVQLSVTQSPKRRRSRPLSAARILRRVVSALPGVDPTAWSERTQDALWWMALAVGAVIPIAVLVHLLLRPGW